MNYAMQIKKEISSATSQLGIDNKKPAGCITTSSTDKNFISKDMVRVIGVLAKLSDCTLEKARP